MGNSLKENWKSICNEYLKRFCDKHEFAYEPDMWVAGDPGTIIEIADMFVAMDDIRYDIDNDIPEDKFCSWYWKLLERLELGLEHDLNYSSFCKGAPWRYSDEMVEHVRELRNELDMVVAGETEF